MTLKLLVLFFTPLIAGSLVYLVPKGKNTNYKLLLVFAGAYLFAITVIHLLPELYSQPVGGPWIGLCVLGGFFLQQFLEYFTSGVEHGHIHAHGGHDHLHIHSSTQRNVSALVLLAALCIHAFLEGAMLAEPPSHAFGYDMNAVLIGIALHRAPAAFALVTVLAFQLGSRRRALPHLIGFSIAAPIGLLVNSYLASVEIVSQEAMIFLYALVCGNFLHISTTIVFESSPEHHFNARKLAVAVLGALVAVVVEYTIG